MNDTSLTSMHEAMRLLQTTGPMEATDVIQRAIRQHSLSGVNTAAAPSMPVQVFQCQPTHNTASTRTGRAAGEPADAAGPDNAAARAPFGVARGLRARLPVRAGRDAGRQGHRQLKDRKRTDDGASRPIIVFHGDADRTVHPPNGGWLMGPFEQGEARADKQREAGRAGHTYTRQRITTPAGVDAEYWVIHGGGHA